MTWSYNPTLSANRDKVRFFAADTDSTAAITLTDEEIAGVLALAGGPRSAAALCCENLAARYATIGQRLTDDLGQSTDYGTRATFYQERARLLRSQAAFAAVPFAGGISVADKERQEDDNDQVSPAFTKTLQDAPQTQATVPADLTRYP